MNETSKFIIGLFLFVLLLKTYQEKDVILNYVSSFYFKSIDTKNERP